MQVLEPMMTKFAHTLVLQIMKKILLLGILRIEENINA